ncbi:hypothetical protein IGI04_009246 [Brassica rapa subsp. trilocularis]|uniref:Uncharacterized protein n=1 Tax=Brassica rapa subsp. trilocularis TaxID=1813537 RepID=A0ABQ7MWR1_BRACM|nr:hypothetical protein IGI04_009246 [Brassica rapa subsp. trilocularis]
MNPIRIPDPTQLRPLRSISHPSHLSLRLPLLVSSSHATSLLVPAHSNPPPLPYLSLQGLLDEASSARSIGGGGGLSRDETLAWELFTPYQRFLIVAVIGVAAAESKKNDVIAQLQNSVDLRDQLLSCMQQKLDNLCQQLSLTKDQSGDGSKVVDLDGDLQQTFKEKFGSEKVKFVECGCWLCDQHHHSSPAIQDKAPAGMVIDAEPEERRMSYLSDWCSSDTTAAEMHFDNLSLDQDMLSLRKECQEKDETIKDLTSFLQLTNKAGSKRETELEEIVRRKKIIIKKLKRDALMLEEKVTQLTRPRRWSCSAAIPSTREFPMRLDNLLYDVDASTSSSSSDSETPPAYTPRPTVLEDAPVDSIKEEPSALGQTQKSAPDKSLVSLVKAVETPSVVSPSTNGKPVSVSSSSSSPRMRRASSSSGDSRKPRRPIQVAPRASFGSSKRWV